MPIVFDPRKSRTNEERRGMPFGMAEEFEWMTSIIGVSAVQNMDTSTRFTALGRIGRAVCYLIFTFEGGNTRIISLRRANKQERARWLASRTHT